jgi:hypothetical protein
MNDDDADEWIDAMLKGWDPSNDGWGPFEFDDIEAGPPLTSIDDLKRAGAVPNSYPNIDCCETM